MRKMLIIIALLVMAGPVTARDVDLPPGRWWEDPRVVERIGLTEGQQVRIREIVFERARRMIDLKAEVDKAGLDLAASVDQQEFDPAPVRAAYAVFQSARHKLENERFEMLLEVRLVLTYEQWQRIEDMKRRMQQNLPPNRRPGGGDGPFGDGPPGG